MASMVGAKEEVFPAERDFMFAWLLQDSPNLFNVLQTRSVMHEAVVNNCHHVDQVDEDSPSGRINSSPG